MALTALDIIVILLVGAGLVFGWLRGFVGEVLSLFAWFLAIVAVRYLHEPLTGALTAPVGTGASVLAFALIFGLVFLAGKLASRRVGAQVRSSVVGPVDRVLGGGFGALKGLIGATLLYLTFSLVYDTVWGRAADRPLWVADARSSKLLQSSSAMMVDLVEARRNAEPESAGNAQ